MSKREKFKPAALPISTVSIGAWGEGGRPIPSATSAVCDVCAGWATTICVTGQTTGNQDLTDRRTSRSLVICVYACEEHHEQVIEALVEEHGWASSSYERDELAERVSRIASRARRR